MATMMTLESNERVWDEILDLENSNRSGSPHKTSNSNVRMDMRSSSASRKSFTKDDTPLTKDDNATLHYSAGLLQRGDTAELPMKESSRPRKKDRRRNRDGTVSRRSATRESRSDRARSLSRGLGRSLSKLRSRSKSALRKTTTDKSKRKSKRKSDVNEQTLPPDPVSTHSADTTKISYSTPDRSTSDDNTINNDGDNDSVDSDTLDHDRGKELMKLFERQQEELKSEMSASIAKFDIEANYWKKKAKALKKKYEGEAATSVGKETDFRLLTSSVFELERKIKDNEQKSGEKIEDLENLLKALGEEKEELKRKANSSSQQAFALEQQVKDRDSSIAQLRHVMEKAEEDSESRIELLERQLDKLVEMKARRPDNLPTSPQIISTTSTTTSSISQTLTASQASYTSNAHTENSHESGDNDNSLEVKNLEALLVRILAEKDKLAFENENLRALVAQNESSSKPVALANLRTYQLSCRNCIDQSFVGQTRDNVKQKVRDHFSEVWYVTRGMDVTVNTDETFMKSSFAQHVAGHCTNCQSSDEVVRWCVKNIKVEKISRKFCGGDTIPSTEKGKNFEF
mmetsp:Transcript_35964/g.73375  ORF Transcript_35964/g.73375 Transcript_35964/m.73375 type:complete len:573 (+) Transcript_35964:150-1868(+)